MISLRAQINQVSAKLTEEVGKVVGSETMSVSPIYQALRQRFVSGQAVVVGLEAKVEALTNMRLVAETELASIPEKEMDVARLMRDQRVNEEIYVMLRSKYEEMRIS